MPRINLYHHKGVLNLLSIMEYIRLSLELNLFFARIAKEHSIFLEAGFVFKNSNLAQEADSLKMQFERLLADTVALSHGVISPEVINSNEIVTPLTLSAERATQFYTNIAINSNITQVELGLMGNPVPIPTPMIEQRVHHLNQRAMVLTRALIQFKSRILSNVLACRLFTTNYPLLIDHILREARFYLSMLTKLQNRQEIASEKELLAEEIFWNQIMSEHAKFIRGLLDPTEVELFDTANNFGKQFDELTKEAKQALEQPASIAKVTADSLAAAKGIRDFKTQGTKGLIECKIKSIALPLLGDHVVREANHFIRILKRG
jgi:hypothetical protein